jgi:hypothetical protein
MEILITKTAESFHVPPGVGKALVAAELAVEIKPLPPSKPVPQTKWSPLRTDGGAYPPILHTKCATCGNTSTTESQRGTAHLSARFAHCGVVETCPDDMAELYLALYREWESNLAKNRRR